METKLNDFNTDLEWSIDKTDDQEVDNVYFKAFPHLEKITPVTDLVTQKRGIDKVLTFSNGQTIYIDEKRRRKDYGDILLEEYSDFEKKKIGWLGREKYTDYIAYIIFPRKKVYLFPFLILQKTYRDNYFDWLLKYGRKLAPNKYYLTSTLPIPTEILLGAIKESMQLSI